MSMNELLAPSLTGMLVDTTSSEVPPDGRAPPSDHVFGNPGMAKFSFAQSLTLAAVRPPSRGPNAPDASA